MMLGHAAGTAASLAIEDKATVQDVNYGKLRASLVSSRQILVAPKRK